jgi:hypothetical protein
MTVSGAVVGKSLHNDRISASGSVAAIRARTSGASMSRLLRQVRRMSAASRCRPSLAATARRRERVGHHRGVLTGRMARPTAHGTASRNTEATMSSRPSRPTPRIDNPSARNVKARHSRSRSISPALASQRSANSSANAATSPANRGPLLRGARRGYAGYFAAGDGRSPSASSTQRSIRKRRTSRAGQTVGRLAECCDPGAWSCSRRSSVARTRT